MIVDSTPRRPRRTPATPKLLTPAQREAFLASAGGWTGLVDIASFKRDSKAARGSQRAPVRL